MEGDNRLRTLVDEVYRAPDELIMPYLRRLRDRREEIAALLDGRSLRLEVVLLARRRHTYRIVFTPSGHVELTGVYGFEPHIRFQGTPDRLIGLMVGSVDTFTAVYDQVLTLYFPPDELVHYPRLRRLLAEQLAACPASAPKV